MTGRQVDLSRKMQGHLKRQDHSETGRTATDANKLTHQETVCLANTQYNIQMMCYRTAHLQPT